MSINIMEKLTRDEIIKKYSGQWGVYASDCYKRPEDEKAQLFLKAFDKYSDAFKFCDEHENNYAIHLTPCC